MGKLGDLRRALRWYDTMVLAADGPPTLGVRDMETETVAAATPIGDAVDEFDSHSIYDLGYVATMLRRAGYLGTLPAGAPRHEMAQRIVDRGLGGELADADYQGQQLVAGYQIAGHVAHWLAAASDRSGDLIGDRMNGRGSAFRAYVASIREIERSLAPTVETAPETPPAS